VHTLILGCGFSGTRIARELAVEGRVSGTRRDGAVLEGLRRQGVEAFALDGGVSEALLERLATVTHLISSVAPSRELPLDDPMLPLFGPLVAAGALPRLAWIGYLSTIGVYGDHAGEWIDEGTPCRSRQQRSIARLEAEGAWRTLGDAAGVPIALLRLSGIYGPGRNAVRDALLGRARVLTGHGQVFNRIHVDDLARAVALSAKGRVGGILNVTDDTPSAPEDVVRYAHTLLGLEPPPAIAFDEAELSPMARSFYGERKRVSNARSKDALGLRYAYPSYRTGLEALLPHELEQVSTGREGDDAHPSV